MSFRDFQNRLDSFHEDRVDQYIKDPSPLAGSQFPGDFNVSGFHDKVIELVQAPSSFWGVDLCLRAEEVPDHTHAYLFHMGIYATAINLSGNYVEPSSDLKFKEFQTKILTQFLDLLKYMEVDTNRIEVTYFGGAEIGGSRKNGRDKLLKRKYKLPIDKVSQKFFKDHGISAFSVAAITNLDINANDGCLVGPRCEVALNGVEIATIVFDYFQIQDGLLHPINYIGGYALGIERLYAMQSQAGTLVTAIPQYIEAHRKLLSICPAAGSILLKDAVMGLIFGIEAISVIPANLSRGQKQKADKIRKTVEASADMMGIPISSIIKVS